MMLPRILIVGEKRENNGKRYFVAGDLEDAVGDEEGVVTVGLYQLMRKRRVIRRIMDVTKGKIVKKREL